MTEEKLKIHSENILPIIKKWLYSDKEIFLRELVSNACDAIAKMKILRDQGNLDCKDEDLHINVSIDKDNKTITIEDTGIGMTKEEVKKYIAQLAFSGAEDFMEKYKSTEDQIIGHFGLGFYSSFMVSSKVEIQTKSYKQGTSAAFWSCDGSSSYTLEKGSKETRGTKIILHIEKDSEEYLEENTIKGILKKHCSYLPCPISFQDERINNKEPLWIKAPSECTEKEYLDFYKALYPFEEDPVFWIHLNVDYPFHLQGILYFPKITKQFDFNKTNLQLYCNRVFVSDHCKDFIPDYLSVLKGIIDSPDIPLNVSRSYLQVDKTVRQLSNHISKKVSDKLSSLHTQNEEEFLSKWPNMEMIIKLGVLQDEKFYDRVKDILLWKNASGEWTTVSNYLERGKEKYSDKIFYTQSDGKSNVYTPFLDIYKEKGIEVLFSSSHLDVATFNLLETKFSPAKFQRIDASYEDLEDKEKEDTVVDKDGKTSAQLLQELVASKFDNKDLSIEAKSLASKSLPGMVLISEEARRMREYMQLTGQSFPVDMPMKQTFVVNTNSNLIKALPKIEKKDPTLTKEISEQLYDLSLLSQKELNADKLNEFIERSSLVLEKLSSHIE